MNNKNKPATAGAVYHGSNGGATRSYLTRLEKRGRLGRIAAQLFRAQKSSARAKVYRGGILRSNGYRKSYQDLAYERKGECLKQLCIALDVDACGMQWGWDFDLDQPYAKNVLYVDLPQGQVSFHSEARYVGPTYEGEWDQKHASENRIIEFCDAVMGPQESRTLAATQGNRNKQHAQG